MNSVRARVAIAATALLAAVGCDFWNNLIDEKTLSHGDLTVRVVDAWTGETLRGGECKDSLRGIDLAPDQDGAFRLRGGSTGPYAIRCGHEWYWDKEADVGLTASGADLTLKLARQGGTSWYPDTGRVSLPRNAAGVVRYPLDLDWVATPTDDSGRFIYEWNFLHNRQFLDRGHLRPHVPLPKNAYSPRYHVPIPAEGGVQEGPDTVILNVYSLLRDPKEPEWVGSDTIPIDWVRNLKPIVKFDSASFSNRRYKVGCQQPKKQISLANYDLDGVCKSLHLWSTASSYSLPGFDTFLSCETYKTSIYLPLVEPGKGTDAINGLDGAEEFENTLIAEIADDNGEKSRDTITFRTFRNVPPFARITAPGRARYLVGDSIPVELEAHDTDGTFSDMYIRWYGVGTKQTMGTENDTLIQPGNRANFPAVVRLWAADSVEYWGWVKDNCAESFETPHRSVWVYESRPPQISNIKGQMLPDGDSALVTLDFEVRDPDADLGDKVASVWIDWGDGRFDPVLPDAPPFNFHAQRTKFLPAPASSIRVGIHAIDAHNVSTVTPYTIPPPAP